MEKTCEKCGTAKDFFHAKKCAFIRTKQIIDRVNGVNEENVERMMSQGLETVDCKISRTDFLNVLKYKNIRKVGLDLTTLSWFDNMLKLVEKDTDEQSKRILSMTMLNILNILEPIYYNIIVNETDSIENSTCPICCCSYEQCFEQSAKNADMIRKLLKEHIIGPRSAELVDLIEFTHVPLAILKNLFEIYTEVQMQCVVDSIGEYINIMHCVTQMELIMSQMNRLYHEV